jgi:hypothetical protein
MRRYSVHGATVLLLAALVVAGTAGVSAATGALVAPTLTTALSSSSIPFGSTAVDTATVTGKGTRGSPTGTVTFSACGPTATATPCTSPNVFSVIVVLKARAHHRSTASVTIIPGAPGWYCFLDTYSGDAHYASVSDNDTATECLHVTSMTAGAAKGSVNPPTITTLSSTTGQSSTTSASLPSAEAENWFPSSLTAT